MRSPADELVAMLRASLPAGWVEAVERGDEDAVERFSASEVGERALKEVAAEGWMTPDWPRELGGRGLGPDDAAAVRAVIRRWRIGRVSGAIGSAWIGPTILQLGTPAQRQRFLPPIARHEELWCQLFSEPDAGSDLAAVRTRAVRDGDTWRLRGQKVWTSRANIASWGLAVARTDPDAPKHGGLTCFCVPMDANGVEIRPIRQMTGDAEFFEVRFDDCAVPDDLRLGEEGAGWDVVKTALGFERVAGSGVGASPPGSVVGRSVDELLAAFGHRLPPQLRDQVVRAYIEARVIEMSNARNRAGRSPDGRPPLVGSVTKVLQAEHTKRLQRLFVDLAGAAGVAYDEGDEWAAANTWAFLRVQAKTIAGGTSEVLRNQIAERLLGLPRDVDPSRGRPWREVGG